MASTRLIFAEMDYQTLLLLASLFTVIQGITSAGVIDKLAELLVGATLGGNITPIGASANITGIGILRKEGYKVKARDFMKISVPFTLTAVLSGYAFIWIFWGLL